MLVQCEGHVYAKSAVCPSAKDILVSDTPSGQFAKTMWQIPDAKHHQVDVSNSMLLFSEEKVGAEKISLEGYFWWRRDNVIIGCAQLKGHHDITTRKLSLKTAKISSDSIPSKARFSATLSDNGMTFLKFSIQGKISTSPTTGFPVPASAPVWTGRPLKFIRCKKMKARTRNNKKHRLAGLAPQECGSMDDVPFKRSATAQRAIPAITTASKRLKSSGTRFPAITEASHPAPSLIKVPL